jgi:hypothetical protein
MKYIMKWLLVLGAVLMAPALASRLGVVNFANGSTTPTEIPTGQGKQCP